VSEAIIAFQGSKVGDASVRLTSLPVRIRSRRCVCVCGRALYCF
jgi:hypothetical protein